MNRCGLWVGLHLLPLAVCGCHNAASCPTSNIAFLKHFTHRPLAALVTDRSRAHGSPT